MQSSSQSIVAPLMVATDRIEPVDSREGFIVRKCVGRRVLHVGCTDWPLTSERAKHGELVHIQVTHAAEACIGLDLSAEGIEKLRDLGIDNIDLGDAERMNVDRYRSANIDLIVAGEVIEHMNNAGLFLEGCADILRSRGELLVTVPNAFSLGRVGRLFFGGEMVHKDHVAYYSPKTMTELLRRYGFEVIFLGVSYPYPTQPLRKPWKIAAYAFHRVWPQFGSSCIFVARVGKSHSGLKQVLR